MLILFGSKYSVFVNSGSSAILLGLVAIKESGYINIGKIVVSSLAWSTDVSIPHILGYKPFLCDCNLEDLSVDLNHLEHLFQTKQPEVLILVSVLGLVPKMKEIIQLCKRYNIILLEDCCESMGSTYKNQNLGTFGLMSFFSTYYGHHISTVEGGFICTDNEYIYDLLLQMRSHGWARDLNKEKQDVLKKENNITDFEELYTFYQPGLNLRNTEIGAFLGLRQMNKLGGFIMSRASNYKKYKEVIKNTLLNLKDDENLISNFAFPILLESSRERERVVERLRKNNIECRPMIAGSMGRQPWWIKKYRKGLS